MPDLSNLNDQENLTLTQISYSSNMLSKHHGKTFAQIRDFLRNEEKNGTTLGEEEKKFLKLMDQFPDGQNPYLGYTVVGTGNNPQSGFGAVAFTDGRGNTGISYRGTDGAPSKKSINDWGDNIVSGITGDSVQCHEAEEFFERYSDKNGNNYLFGHSKGGNLSEYVYVKYYEKIKGMHLLNPQPINPWTLTPAQLKAMQSDKVDIVIVEGDYVWFIGMLPSYGNVRVVDSNDQDSHSYWSVKFQDGSVSEGNHPWWEFLVFYGVTLLSPIIQGAGALFGVLCNCVDKFILTIKEGWEKCKEFAAWVCDKVRKIGEGFKEFADNLKDFFDKLETKAKEWYNKNFNAGYKYATSNPNFTVDTYKLKRYASRLQDVNRRISKLDGRLDSLYWQVGLLDLWNLMKADLMTGYSWRLLRAAGYLNDTTADLEAIEKELVGAI